MNRNLIGSIYGRASIGIAHFVLIRRTFHRCFLLSFGSFGKAVSEEKIFRNRPIRNKNCLWQPCMLMDRDKMRTLYRGPYIDAYCQVWFHLAKLFQRRRLKYEKVNGRRRTPSDGNTSYESSPLKQLGQMEPNLA
jgi:hypothetical protein